MFATNLTIDLNQGIGEDNRKFGYVTDGNGGYFFIWMPTLTETLDSLDADETDAPEFSKADAREALEAKISNKFAE